MQNFIFFKTTEPISTKLCTKHLLKEKTKHPYMKGVCSNDGLLPFPRRVHSKILKIYWQLLKRSSSLESFGQIQANLAQSILGWKVNKFVQMKGNAHSSPRRNFGKIVNFNKTCLISSQNHRIILMEGSTKYLFILPFWKGR